MEPKKIPDGVSPVRHIMAETDPKKEFHPLAGFEEAKKDPDGVAVFEGDYGGQIMMTIRMKHVKCSERALELLLSDLNNIAWDDGGHGEGLYYERIAVGGGVTGGMGGGCVVDGVWAHERFEKDGVDLDRLGKAVGDILECRAERLPAGLKGKPRG